MAGWFFNTAIARSTQRTIEQNGKTKPWTVGWEHMRILVQSMEQQTETDVAVGDDERYTRRCYYPKRKPTPTISLLTSVFNTRTHSKEARSDARWSCFSRLDRAYKQVYTRIQHYSMLAMLRHSRKKSSILKQKFIFGRVFVSGWINRKHPGVWRHLVCGPPLLDGRGCMLVVPWTEILMQDSWIPVSRFPSMLVYTSLSRSIPPQRPVCSANNKQRFSESSKRDIKREKTSEA